MVLAHGRGTWLDTELQFERSIRVCRDNYPPNPGNLRPPLNGVKRAELRNSVSRTKMALYTFKLNLQALRLIHGGIGNCEIPCQSPVASSCE